MYRNYKWELEHGFRHDSVFGGGDVPQIPTPPPVKAPPAVLVDAGTKGREKAYDRRKRMALAGQQSMMGGGSMATGGSVSGRSLMGS